MKILIMNNESDPTVVVDSVEAGATSFWAFITFLREWKLYDDFKKIMEYVDKGEDLVIKAKFKLDWP